MWTATSAIKEGVDLSEVYRKPCKPSWADISSITSIALAAAMARSMCRPKMGRLSDTGGKSRFILRAQSLRRIRAVTAALTSTKSISGPEFTMRYTLYRSAQINGSAAPRHTSSALQATKAHEETFAQTMPPEMGFDYIGISFQEQKAAQGVPPIAIFGLSFLFVFLILAALYESWSLPFSVLLGTPIAVLGAFVALWMRHMVNNVFAQIGLVMLIGLAAKNAILIVEFARLEYEKGKPLIEAALTGARIRLRPILMTSFAFILGTVPLGIATGAGAISRRIIGTVVIGGMLAATCIAVCLIPVMFFVVEKFAGKRREEKTQTKAGASGATNEGTV